MAGGWAEGGAGGKVSTAGGQKTAQEVRSPWLGAEGGAVGKVSTVGGWGAEGGAGGKVSMAGGRGGRTRRRR